MIEKLKNVLIDPLFSRVAVCVFGLAITIFSISRVLPLALPYSWGWLAFYLVLTTSGSFLVFVSLLASDTFFDKATQYLDINTDILGLLFIVIVGSIAIPVTILLRELKKKSLF